MRNLEEKLREIEAMRVQLHRLVLNKNGNMIDPEVAEMSIQLDRLIVDYEQSKREDRKKSSAC